MGMWNRIRNAWRAMTMPTVNMDDEELLDWLGITTRDKRKISEVTYFTCMKMLSETMGKLPLKYYQDTPEGKIRADPTDMTRLLTVRPNPVMTPTTLWSSAELNCQHYGNAYVWIQRNFLADRYGGEVINYGLWLMPSCDVTVLMDDAGIFQEKGKLYYQYTDAKTGELYVFPQEDVLHFKTGYSLNGIMGEPVRKIIGSSIDGALESQTFMNHLYEQGLTASAVLYFPAGELDGKRRKELQNRYEKYLTGSKNAGKIVPVPIGLELKPLNMSLTDAQFFELRKYSALQIAGAFGIKPNQINNYEKSSYANSETQQLAFLVDTMSYRMKAYEEEINYKCLNPKEIREGYYYKYNEKVILRTDAKTQMGNLSSAVNNGIYTPNEAREYLDLPQKEGGDILMVNGNYIPITMVGKQYGKEGERNEGSEDQG